MFKEKIRIGHSYDLHNLITGNKIILGSVEIPSQFSVDAISDGDVVLHTISEAILGALSLGDLGDFFTSENSKNLSSVVILDTVLLKLKNFGYKISNIDMTIILDEPSLKEYKNKIKLAVAKLLSINDNQINIKATTTEKNFTKVIAAHSVLLLEKIENI